MCLYRHRSKSACWRAIILLPIKMSCWKCPCQPRQFPLLLHPYSRAAAATDYSARSRGVYGCFVTITIYSAQSFQLSLNYIRYHLHFENWIKIVYIIQQRSPPSTPADYFSNTKLNQKNVKMEGSKYLGKLLIQHETWALLIQGRLSRQN